MEERTVSPARAGAVADSHPARLQALQAQRRAIMALPPDQALERILGTPQPAALVHSFPPEDLYLLAHEAGLEDALPLIRLASAPQWEFFLDMDAWRGDRLDLGAAIDVFRLLDAADPRRFTQWICDDHLMFFELILSRTVELAIREHDQDPGSLGEGFDTQDDIFYYRVRRFSVGNEESEENASSREEFLRELVAGLARKDHRLFTELLQEAVTSIYAEAEEEAYRMHNVRLAERGFFPPEEAAALYSPLPAPRGSIPHQTLREGTPVSGLPVSVPLYPFRQRTDNEVFSDSLARIDDGPTRQRLSLELANLCNRIAAADRCVIREREALAAVVRKACGFIGIGLEYLSTETADLPPSSPESLLRRHALESLFRTGYGQALALKRDLEKWRRGSWFVRQGLPLSFWDEKWVGVLGGLLLKRPKCYGDDLSGNLMREFGTLEEIRQARQVLADVMAMDGILSRIALPRLRGRGDAQNWKRLLLTFWARETLGLAEAGDGPIALARFRPFFASLWEDGVQGRQVGKGQKSAMLAWLAGRSRLALPEVSRQAGEILETLFEELREEYGAVSPRALAPHLVRHFWLH